MENEEFQKSQEILNDLKHGMMTVDVIESVPSEVTPFGKYIDQFVIKGGKKKNPNIVASHGSIGLNFPLSVPFSRELEFKTKYAESIQKGEIICLDEKRTNIFYLFFDLDFKFSEKVEWDVILPYCGRITYIVGKIFFKKLWDNNIDEVVSSPEECVYDDEILEWNGFGDNGRGRLRSILITSYGISSNDKFSIGIHLHFPGKLAVNAEQAIIIRNYVVEDLKNTFGERNLEIGENSWSDVLDPSPFLQQSETGAGGIRMIGSAKTDTCSRCLGTRYANMIDINQHPLKFSDEQAWSEMKKNQEKCTYCQGKGKVQIKKLYFPKFILIPNENSKFYAKLDNITEKWLFDPKNYLQLVLATSIRCAAVASSEEYSCPEGIVPSNLNPKNNTKRKISQSDTLITKKALLNVASDGQEPRVGQSFNINSEAVRQLQELIRKSSFNWSLLRIKQMERKTEGYYKIDVEGIGAGYCLNASEGSEIGKDHAQKEGEIRIYFLLYIKNGLLQKCYSKKYNCNEKSPRFFDVPLKLRMIFFTEKLSKLTTNYLSELNSSRSNDSFFLSSPKGPLNYSLISPSLREEKYSNDSPPPQNKNTFNSPSPQSQSIKNLPSPQSIKSSPIINKKSPSMNHFNSGGSSMLNALIGQNLCKDVNFKNKLLKLNADEMKLTKSKNTTTSDDNIVNSPNYNYIEGRQNLNSNLTFQEREILKKNAEYFKNLSSPKKK